MGYVRIKASANSVGCNGTNPALIGTIFPTFACVGCHLQAKFLNYSLNLLFVDEISLIMKLSMYSTISVILIILTDFLDFSSSSLSGFSLSNRFCQYIYVALGMPV